MNMVSYLQQGIMLELLVLTLVYIFEERSKLLGITLPNPFIFQGLLKSVLLELMQVHFV